MVHVLAQQQEHAACLPSPWWCGMLGRLVEQTAKGDHYSTSW
jgi:hypothetical protein